MRRLVIFDVDGTLVDSQAHIIASMAAAFEHVGQPAPARETVLSVVGLSLPLAIREVAAKANLAVDGAALEGMTQAYKAAFQHHRLQQGAAASPLYPGAEAAVRALSARDDIALAIATGKSRRGLDALVADWDFADAFVSLECADDHPSKPHPSMVMSCLADSDVAPDSAVVIGDTSYDMEMARAARTRAIGVSWGYHGPEALRSAGAAWIVNDFAELLPALDALWKGE